MLRKGFSLIEAAIVLGIIGLVIGGIWVAASAVSRNLKAGDLNSLILQSVNMYRKLVGSNRSQDVYWASTPIVNGGISNIYKYNPTALVVQGPGLEALEISYYALATTIYIEASFENSDLGYFLCAQTLKNLAGIAKKDLLALTTISGVWSISGGVYPDAAQITTDCHDGYWFSADLRL